VFYVPQLRVNVLSMLRLTNKGLRVTFDANECSVHDESGKRFTVAERYDSHYVAQYKLVNSFVETTVCSGNSGARTSWCDDDLRDEKRNDNYDSDVEQEQDKSYLFLDDILPNSDMKETPFNTSSVRDETGNSGPSAQMSSSLQLSASAISANLPTISSDAERTGEIAKQPICVVTNGDPDADEKIHEIQAQDETSATVSGASGSNSENQSKSSSDSKGNESQNKSQSKSQRKTFAREATRRSRRIWRQKQNKDANPL